MEIVIATYADRIQEWRAASHDRMAIIDAINGLAMIIREGFGTPALIDMQGAPTFRQINIRSNGCGTVAGPSSLFRRDCKMVERSRFDLFRNHFLR